MLCFLRIEKWVTRHLLKQVGKAMGGYLGLKEHPQKMEGDTQSYKKQV